MTANVPGASLPSYLVDTSPLSRLGHHRAVQDVLMPLLREGQLAWADPTRLEMGITARNATEHAHLGTLLAALPRVDLLPTDFDRAWQVQGLLAHRAQHQGVALPDLLLAACAERLGLAVIHCDADFDLISDVTGQRMLWAIDRSLL